MANVYVEWKQGCERRRGTGVSRGRLGSPSLGDGSSANRELDFHISESDSGIGDSEDVNISLEEDELEDSPTLLKRYRKCSLLTALHSMT